MTDSFNLTIRPLTESEVRLLVQLADQEGWNPGPNDGDVYFQTDPEGFLGIFQQEELIGGGSIISYNAEFGFMGLFIVKPEYRGLGIGRTLWVKRRDTLLSRLKRRAAIGMDAVPEMQAFYASGGFEIAFRDERYKRPGEVFPADAHIGAITDEDWSEVLAMDLECFGFARPQFLQPWFAQPNMRTFRYRDEQGLQGFAGVRQMPNGWKVGPLFAESPVVGEALYRAILSTVPDEPVFLDIPEPNDAAVALVRKYEATKVDECARMYYGTPPKLPLQKIFGITTFELG